MRANDVSIAFLFVSHFFFFFQAEDGIRDGHVTGVQTCALPISGAAASGRLLVVPGPGVVELALPRRGAAPRPDTVLVPGRSEERRVGKEWRSRRGGCG